MDRSLQTSQPVQAPIDTRSRVLWGAGAAAAASAFFGGMVLATRFAVGHADPVTVAFFRSGIGALCLLPVLLRSGLPRLRREDVPAVVGLGILLYAVMPFTMAFGIQFTYASRGALVLVSQPLITLLLSWWRGEESMTGAKLAGIALAATGVLVGLGSSTSAPGQPSALWLGDLTLLVTSLCVSAYTVLSRPYLRRYPPLAFTALTMTAGAFALLPALVAVNVLNGVPHLGGLDWLALLYTGTFGAAVGYGLWCWALERTTPMRVTIFLPLNPLVATLLGAALLGEPVGPQFAAGLAIVFAGIALAHAGAFTGTGFPPGRFPFLRRRRHPASGSLP